MSNFKTLIAIPVCLCLLGFSFHVSETSAGENGLKRSTVSLLAAATLGHCEIPCGIYDDHAEIQRMLLDAETMRKASAQIVILSEQLDAASLNTLSRWVGVKEEHSKNIQHVNAWYFMTQRIKAVAPETERYDEYVSKLTAHHAVSVAAMKAAQSLDPSVQAGLTRAIQAVSGWYPKSPERAEGVSDSENWQAVARKVGS
jgi:nickel superoxide dismutase